MGEQIHGTALEAHDDAVGILKDLEGHLVQLGGGAPVSAVLLHDDGLLCGARDELEGAGAHGLGVLLGIVGGQNGQSQVDQEFVVGFCQRDDHGALIGSFHALNSRKRRHLNNSCFRCSGTAFDGIYYVFRCDRISVVEGNALTNGEGVGQTVRGDGVVFSNSGNQIAISISWCMYIHQR